MADKDEIRHAPDCQIGVMERQNFKSFPRPCTCGAQQRWEKEQNTPERSGTAREAPSSVRPSSGAAHTSPPPAAARAGAPRREDVMRAIFEAHRGPWGYSRFHASPDVRARAQKNWDTLKERKPEEWESLEDEADAVLALYDAAPEAPLPGQSAEGMRALLLEAREWLADVNADWVNKEAVQEKANNLALRIDHALDAGYQKGPAGPPITLVGDSNTRGGSKARDNSAATTPSPAGQGEAMPNMELDLDRLWAEAIKDDFGSLVPSDVRQLIGEARRFRASAQPTPPAEVTHDELFDGLIQADLCDYSHEAEWLLENFHITRREASHG